MSTYYSFNERAVSEALDAAKKNYEDRQSEFQAIGFDPGLGSHVLMGAEVITVIVKDHEICLNLPMGLGAHCITIPARFPNGTEANACLDICSKQGVSAGVKVSIIIGGVKVASAPFGKC